MTAPILYFDLGSPYAYLAVERAGRVLGVEPELRPILLGAIFKMRGHGSWAHTPERAAGEAEVERRAREYGLAPVKWPPDWPSNTLAAMRVAVWAGRDFALAAFRRAFVEGGDLGDLDVLAGVAGVSRAQLEAVMGDPAVKEALRSATQSAWDRGVAGVPTLAVDGQLFYGDDQLEKAADS
jgi:2-hydroxychromene-2-carboxylate isomerase